MEVFIEERQGCQEFGNFWPTGNGRVGVNIGRLASGRGLLGRLWW